MPTMLSAAMRDILIEHLDDNSVLWIRNSQSLPPERRVLFVQRTATRDALIERGWITFDARYRRPHFTYITDDGRRVLAKALGEWADALDRAYVAMVDKLATKPPRNHKPDAQGELIALFRIDRKWLRARTKSEQMAEESFA